MVVDLSQRANRARALSRNPAAAFRYTAQSALQTQREMQALGKSLVEAASIFEGVQAKLRVASNRKGPGDHTPGTRRNTRNANYDYRQILPNEVVLDIGDKVPWLHSKRVATATASALRRWHIAHDLALSAGTGIHIHFFSEEVEPSVENARESFEVLLRQQVCRDLGLSEFDDPEELHLWDMRCIGSDVQLIREYGATKKYRKTLWYSWPGERWKALPDVRAQAYIDAGIRVPREIPINESLPGAHHRIVAKATNKRCPRSVDCETAMVSEWSYCEDCPLTW